MSSFYMELFTSTIVKGSLSNHSDDDNFKKQYCVNVQNNVSAHASHFSVHFFDVHWTTTTWNLINIRLEIFLSLFKSWIKSLSIQFPEKFPTFDKLSRSK